MDVGFAIVVEMLEVRMMRKNAKSVEHEALSEGAKVVSKSRKSAKKRDEIMAAATEIINNKTYALATMSEIAASLDLRDATLYYYFPSKQALAFACHCKAMDRFESFLQLADGDGKNGAEKIERFFWHLLDDSNRNGPLLYFGDYFHLELFHQEQIQIRSRQLTKALERFIKVGIEDGSIAPCETKLVVNLMLGMLIWLAKWTGTIEGLTVDRLMSAITALAFQGLYNRPGA
jgi:AcrR family transcriptional regulator